MALTIPAGVGMVTEMSVVVLPLVKDRLKAAPLFNEVLRNGKMVLAVR
jgi:hypothetical protein